MASNKIQIKRSTANAVVTGLSNGELAFTQASNTLWIGLPDGSGTASIGGVRNPGTLTANQALVANSTSGINKIITANAVVTTLWANGSAGIAGDVLFSNGSASYWTTSGAIAINTASQYVWSNTQTFNGGVVFGNTVTANGTVGSAGQVLHSDGTKAYWAADDQGVTSVATGSGLTGGTISTTGTISVVANNGIVANATGVYVQGANGVSVTAAGVNVLAGNSQIIANASGVYVNGAALSIATSQLTGDVALGTNTSGNYVATITAGAGVSGSSSSEGGTPTIAVVANNGIVANTTGVFAKQANGITVDAGGINVLAGTNGGLVSNSTGVFVTAAGGLVANATGVHVGAGNGISVDADSIRVLAGNSQVISNATGVYVNGASFSIATSQLTGDVALGTNTSGNYVATIAAGAGISGSSSTEGGTPTIAIVANSGIIANSTGVFVNANTGVVANSSGVFIGQPVATTSAVTFQDLTINGNTILGDASADIINVKGTFSNNLMPNANVTYDIGTNNMRWREIHASNVHSVTGYFDGDVEISGNLIVTGNVTTTNVTSIIVSDPMLYLAANNTAADLVDIGFAATYYDSAVVRHTGFFRDATDGVWKLFANSTQSLVGNNVVNTTATGYTTGTLNAYINGTALSTNSTSITITANSTVAVSIVANSLSLSTPLSGTSGGTGLSTIANNSLIFGNSTNGFNTLALNTTAGYVLQSNGTAIVYDTLDGGTF